MQMPGGVGFGGQHGIELLAGQLADHRVIEHPGGVDDRAQPVLGGNGLQQRAQLVGDR